MRNIYSLFSLLKSPRKNLIAALIGIFFIGSLQSTAEAQVNTYSFAQSSGTFSGITGTVLATATGNASATNLNSAVYPVTLPFPFTFNGTAYSAINVSTNGFITFGSTPPAATTTTPISGTVAYEGAIAAWGRDISSYFDINGKTGDIRWQTLGSAPNREVVVQWSNFRPNSSTVATAVYGFSFQIRLKETSNVAQIVYDSGVYLAGSTAVDLTAQIGLRGATNADFKNRLNPDTVEFTNSSQGTANNSTQSFNTSVAIPGMPSAGLTYTFTPSSCLPPASVATNGVTTSGATVNWAASTSAPSGGYDVYYTTSSTAPLNTVTPQHTSVAALTQTLQGLMPSTVYYVYVRSNCGAGNVSEWSLATSFATLCAPVSTLFEDFDSYATGSIVPLCWDRIITSTGSQTISATGPASGTRNIYQYSTATQNPSVVVLPVFSNVNAGTHWLRFKARVTTATGTLNVGYVTNPADAGTFNIIQSLSIANTAYDTTSEYTVLIPTSIPSNARLAIMNSPDGKSYYWDDLYWEAAPSCLPPSLPTSTATSTATGTVSWTASPSTPANGYEYYYSTTNTDPLAGTTPSGTVAAGILTANIGGLSPNTVYYTWIRSVCNATNRSNWVAVPSFKTFCAPTASMAENFDSYATGIVFPDCWDRLVSTGTLTISSTGPASGTRNIYQYSTTTQNATIAILPPFSNINAGTHWLRFKARVTAAPGTLTVGYITDAGNPSTFVPIQVLNITNTAYDLTSEYSVPIPTTVPANARLAIMNQADSKLYYWDDIFWEAIPTCIVPTNITTSNPSATSATVQWTASITAPASGYDIYYSTVNTAPTSATVPNYIAVAGVSQVISPLTPSTAYYVWVRSNCSATDKSPWVAATGNLVTACQAPTITVATPTAVCINGQAALSAAPASGATVNWYANATGGSALATGNTYTTPPLSATTTYYASASTGALGTVGKTALESNATTGGGQSSYLIFTALSDFTLNTVDLFPFSSVAGTTGTVTVTLFTSTGTPITSSTVNVIGQSSVASSVPQTVTLNFPVVGGSSYRLGVSGWTGITNLYRDATNLSFPYSLSGVVDITGGSLATPYYYFFYNWKVTTGCESPRQPVVATVDSSCTLSVDDLAVKNQDLSIYPNPVADILYFKSKTNVTEVEVYSVSGQRIQTIKDKNITSVNLQNLTSGVYLIKIKLENGQKISKKIVKK